MQISRWIIKCNKSYENKINKILIYKIRQGKLIPKEIPANTISHIIVNQMGRIQKISPPKPTYINVTISNNKIREEKYK